jgi:protoporphyrinogen/coproporphyrinogen III oxidase
MAVLEHTESPMAIRFWDNRKGGIMDYRVAIVGAGISGLAAAYTLKKSGFSAVVFEKESFPGGRMSSETVNGCIIDKGAYTIPDFYKVMPRLLGELGLQPRLVKTPATSSTFLEGKEYQSKVGSPSDFMKYKLLSLNNKLDVMKLFLYSQSLGKALDLDHPSRKTYELEQETAAEYLLKNYNEEVLERIGYPVFCELFLGNPECNSKLAFLATLANLTKFSIYTFDGGMGTLPDYLAGTLDVRLNTPVLRIRKKTPGDFYEILTRDGKERSFLCDAVILAAPLPAVVELLEDVPEEMKASLRAIEYTPSLVTVWGLGKHYQGHSMINTFLRKDAQVIGTVVCDDVKAPNRVPDGKGLATAILNEVSSRSLFDAPDDKIHASVLPEMDRVFPGFSEQVLFARTYRWKHAVVQLPPGALAKKHSLRKSIEETFGRIYVASDSLYHTTLETSLQTGITAAQKIIDTLPH